MKKKKNVLKKVFSLYNLAIILMIIVIAVCTYIVLKPDNWSLSESLSNLWINIESKKEQKEEKVTTPSRIEVVEANVKKDEEISEEEARKLAQEQFKTLGETVEEESLNVQKIQRDKDIYYYITSVNNSIEIKLIGGKVTRINAALVEE